MVANFYFKDNRVRQKQAEFVTLGREGVETTPATQEDTTVEMTTTTKLMTFDDSEFQLSVENVTSDSASLLMTTSSDVRAVDVTFTSSVLPVPIRQRMTMFKKINVFRFTSLPSGDFCFYKATK